MQRLVEGVLLQWAAASAGGGSAHLAERVEELFLEASMLEAVRRGQVRSWLVANQAYACCYSGQEGFASCTLALTALCVKCEHMCGTQLCCSWLSG